MKLTFDVPEELSQPIIDFVTQLTREFNKQNTLPVASDDCKTLVVWGENSHLDPSEMNIKFDCWVYDLWLKNGLYQLVDEEESFVAMMCDYLVRELGVIDDRWKAVSFAHYVLFNDLRANRMVNYYDLAEKDRRKIDAVLTEKGFTYLYIGCAR